MSHDKEGTHAAVTERLKQVYPEAVCALHYTHDYELLFADAALRAVYGRAREHRDGKAVF